MHAWKGNIATPAHTSRAGKLINIRQKRIADWRVALDWIEREKVHCAPPEQFCEVRIIYSEYDTK